MAHRQSVLLTGIRRTGKTQVLKAVLVRHAEQGGLIGFLDVQDCVSLHAFYRDLLRQMPKTVWDNLTELLVEMREVPDRLLSWFRNHVDRIEVNGAEVDFNPPGDDLPRYWQPVVERLQQVLSQQKHSELPVLGIDELPFMLENLLKRGIDPNELAVMLAGLRKLRDAGLRLIVAGSVSMENLLTLHAIPHTVLGGLWREVIPPFTRDEAQGYLRDRLAGNAAGGGPATDTILEHLPDYIPEFLNIAATAARNCTDTAACEAAMRQTALPAIRRSFLTQFDERLVKNYPNADLAIAEQILDIVARAEASGCRLDGNALPPGYRQVVLKLQYDNFILEGQDFNWLFSLNLLRQWWRATRGMEQ
ncbi:hypothetical protein [Desulfobulbus sp.]|uniref:hypothetical protein n=1 Tax=Desulfobulbus sp. TaxID=895 RepID=UPI00286F90F1|nr:hypothetical protein [Desulfobulbus sp.]